jgi:hypothetical protein
MGGYVLRNLILTAYPYSKDEVLTNTNIVYRSIEHHLEGANGENWAYEKDREIKHPEKTLQKQAGHR